MNPNNFNPTNSQQAELPQQETGWQKCVNALTPEVIERMKIWRDISVETWEKLKHDNMIGMYDSHIAFPIISENKEVIGCHHRSLEESGTWVVTWFGAKGLLTSYIIDDPKSKTEVVAFESQWDLIAFLDMFGWHKQDLPNFGYIATRGAMNSKKIADFCNPDTVVYAIVQNDDAGQKWFERIVRSVKCEVRRVNIPKKVKDLNDWKRDGATLAELCDAINNAEVFPAKTPATQIQRETTSSIEDIEEIYPGIKPLETFTDGRSPIPLAADNRLLSDFANDVGRALSATEIFNRRGHPFTIDRSNKSLALVTSDAFRTLAETWLVCYKVEKSKDSAPSCVYRSMSKADAGAVLASVGFQKQLRPIRRVNHARLPVLRQDGKIELLPLGYDSESQTYTFEGSDTGRQENMTLDEAKICIKELFEEFCFPDDAGRSVAVALSAMLTLFGNGLLPQGAIPPCFIVRANAEGAGKTALVKAIIMGVFDSFVAGVKPVNDDEVRKFLTAAVLEERHYVVYDNVKNHLDSPSLEAFLTTPFWSDRILGASKSFTAEKFTVVFITGNDCTVSPDMRRRSLVLELFMQEERAEERKFKRELDSFLKLNRPKIFSALWVLVDEWDKRGRQASSYFNSSFPEWSRIIASIVEFAGFGSPLAPPLNAGDIDRDGADMRRLVNALPVETQFKEYTFAEL